MAVNNDFRSLDALPPLPQTAFSKDGFEYTPALDAWVINSLLGRFTFKFDTLSSFSETMVRCLKLVFVWYLENRSFAHARNLSYCLSVFYRQQFGHSNAVLDRIDLHHIISFRASLDEKTEWKLGVVRILLEDLHRLGIGITSPDVLEYLHASTIRGNIKGTSVRTRDEKRGAFNDTDLLAIQSGLNDAYAKNVIGLYQFAIAWLFLGYGPRPVQIAALRESDLTVSVTSEGRFYALRMPRAKQQGQDVRSSFKTRYCSKQIGMLLEEVIAYNRMHHGDLDLSDADRPMFVSRSEGGLPNLRYHIPSERIVKAMDALSAHVPGIKTNSKRFRITLAQRAVDDGKDKHTVAELLDHSDTQSVGVYYEASPAMVPRLDRHLAMELAPIAQAFAGVVVTIDGKQGSKIDPSTRIFDRSLNNAADDALGSCGQMSFCGLAIPFACYTCRHFKPWRDGPHEEFMSALIDDRERMIVEDISPKLYTIRDRTILAVAEVIQLCAAQLDEGEVAF